MKVTCWSDYLCPWCYVGLARDGLFAEVGLVVDHQPFELHPEIGPEGRRVRPDGRLAPTFDRVEDACVEASMPFRRPIRMPNSRRALETAAWVRQVDSAAHDDLHRALFRAQFVTGDPIDEPEFLDSLVSDVGLDADEIRAAVDDGRASVLVDRSMAAARARGVTSTPSWVVGDLVIPGALDPDTLRRWLTKLVERNDA